MKLKCQPEDFRVEELPLVSPAGTGRYTFYRLSKRNIGTIEAVRGDLSELESGRPSRQLRGFERPACRHDPVPDDRGRPAQDVYHARTSSLSRSGGWLIPTVRIISEGIGSISSFETWAMTTFVAPPPKSRRSRATASPTISTISGSDQSASPVNSLDTHGCSAIMSARSSWHWPIPIHSTVPEPRPRKPSSRNSGDDGPS